MLLPKAIVTTVLTLVGTETGLLLEHGCVLVEGITTGAGGLFDCLL